MKNIRQWAAAAFFMLLSGLASATHIRSIDIQWSVPDPINSPRTVEFVMTEVGRASYPWGTTPPTDTGRVVIRNSSNTVVSSLPIALTQVGSGVDAANGTGTYDGNYVVLRGTVTTTLPALGVYTASTTDSSGNVACCTASNMANNNNDQNYGAMAKVVLDGQRGGPVAAVQPILNLTRGSLQTVSFPMFDPDGDPVSCRFATSLEAFNLPTPIPKIGTVQATISSVGNECQISWDLTGVTTDSFHFLPLIIESTHNGSISSIGIDRMLLVTNKAYPSCTGGGYIGLQPNQVFSTQFTGTATSNLSFAVTGAPAGSTFSPASGTSGSSPMPVTFAWTPTSAQAGSSYIMQAVFKDASNVEGPCNYVINVDALNPVVSLNSVADVPNGVVAQLVGHVTNRTSGTVQVTLTDSQSQTHVIPATISASGDWQAASPANLPIGAVQISVALQNFAVLPATGSFNVLAVIPVLSGVAPNGQVGSVYSFTPNIGPANVTLPVTFALTGSLPNGLSFNTATGAITGTPTLAGSSAVSIEAINSGGSGHLNLTLMINKIASTTELTVPPNLTMGQTVNFSVAVTAASGVPTGNVVVSGGSDTCTATLSAGLGSCQFTPTNANGNFPLTAVYSGDANTLTSQDMKVVAIAKASQTISFTSSVPANAKVGTMYNVAATGGLSGNAVTFAVDVGSTTICSIAGGLVSFNTAGNCTINSNQLGNANYNDASQAQQSILINQAGSGVSITSSNNPSQPAQSVTFTIAVTFDAAKSTLQTKAAPVPTGTVEIFDGSTSLGTAVLLNGSASITTTQLIITGSHSLIAKFSGDANYPAEQSMVFTQTVASAVATPVPTLSDWMLIGLSSILAMLGVVAAKRRRS